LLVFPVHREFHFVCRFSVSPFPLFPHKRRPKIRMDSLLYFCTQLSVLVTRRLPLQTGLSSVLCITAFRFFVGPVLQFSFFPEVFFTCLFFSRAPPGFYLSSSVLNDKYPNLSFSLAGFLFFPGNRASSSVIFFPPPSFGNAASPLFVPSFPYKRCRPFLFNARCQYQPEHPVCDFSTLSGHLDYLTRVFSFRLVPGLDIWPRFIFPPLCSFETPLHFFGIDPWLLSSPSVSSFWTLHLPLPFFPGHPSFCLALPSFFFSAQTDSP